MLTIVLRLFYYRSDQVVLLRDLSGFHDLNCRPLRSTPIVSQIQIADALREALDNLFHWRGHIRAVSKHNVDIGLLQAAQRALQAFYDVLSAQATGVWLFTAGAEEDFGAEHVLISRPRELLQCLTHLDLTLSVGVYLCGVEEVDAIVPCALQAVFDHVTLLCAAVRQPSAKRKN